MHSMIHSTKKIEVNTKAVKQGRLERGGRASDAYYWTNLLSEPGVRGVT
jgi:hypothetical protein